MTRSRFIEFEDDAHTNHGKFLVTAIDVCDEAVPSQIAPGPLLASLPVARRFGGPIAAGAVWLCDLQTREGALYDLAAPEPDLRRAFLCHPLHVCILYFPALLFLARRRARLWELPARVTLPAAHMLEQPGVLVDVRGRQVRSLVEWSPRRPLAARFRNREVPEGGDPELGQGELTDDERGGGR